ncbi:MAG: hypothetical protein HYT76_07870 [Deltaproteobacteria bacterium]|nr:hypothetical protein [Deltaproteobacteria bacterium]
MIFSLGDQPIEMGIEQKIELALNLGAFLLDIGLHGGNGLACLGRLLGQFDQNLLIGVCWQSDLGDRVL